MTRLSRAQPIPRRRRCTCATAALASLFLGLTSPARADAQDRTIIEEHLVEQNLCAGLRTEQFGQTIAIDELDSVELREVDLSLRGDDVTASFAGRLACRSPTGSLLSGDASAAVRAEARLSLADCRIDTVSIGLDDFGGSFGPLLGAFAPQIEEALAGEARQLLADACRDFAGRPRN